MRPIICPTDFSVLSSAAARYAADMCAVLGAKLCLVHVCPLPVTVAEVPIPPYPFDHTISEAEHMITELKEKLLHHTKEAIEIETEVRMGFLMTELADYCKQQQPYAVVMGAENAKGLERLVAGASTFTAITKLPWPVIVVPEDVVFGGIKKIALACDLKDVVETIPEKQIVALVKAFHAELHVLHIGGDAGSFTPGSVAESGLLQEMLDQVDPVYHFIEGDDVEQTIVAFLDKHSFDMLFVFPKHHNLFTRIFQHSRSKRLVLQSHIPVAALHEN